MDTSYETIFKRRSVRRFDKTLSFTDSELKEIEAQTEKLIPLDKDVRVKFKVVKRSETTAKLGEYCLLMYSEKKPSYLLNAGYMLEQMDLYLSSRQIGVCWYGMCKAKQSQLDGLDYVILLAFGKSSSQDSRDQVSQFRRKSKAEIWQGDFDPDVVEAVRLAPSACNSQPWRVSCDGNQIKVYRNTKVKSFVPFVNLSNFNPIDMGICLYFLETALAHKGYAFERTLLPQQEDSGQSLIEIAKYAVS